MLGIFKECPFLIVALALFILVGAVGIAKEGVFVGIGIGLLTSFIFVVLFLLVMCLIIGGIFRLGDRRWLQPKKQESQYGKRFIVGTMAFLVAVAVFTGGVKYAVAIGAVLIAMVICAHFLTRTKEFG